MPSPPQPATARHESGRAESERPDAAEATGVATSPFVSVVLPCRNEIATVASCVRRARKALERYGYDGEIIVCDNGSRDGSADAARAAGARVVKEPETGYGRACRRGLRAARGKVLVLADADGTYDFEVLNRFVEPLRAGHDVVVGTRRNGRMHPAAMSGWHRHILEPAQTWLLRTFFDLPISDVRCGLRSFRRDAIDRMELEATGAEFASEVLIETARLGLEAVEVPVTFHPREGTPPRRSSRSGWRVVRQILMLSPTHLFLAPGLLMLAAGIALEAVLLPGPVWLGSVPLDYHFMFVGTALSVLGLQVALLGLSAKTYFLYHGRPGMTDPWIRRFHDAFRLELGLLTGALLFVAGLAVDVALLAEWWSSQGPEFFAVRPATAALTLMVLGAEVGFASFFLDVLRSSGAPTERRR